MEQESDGEEGGEADAGATRELLEDPLELLGKLTSETAVVTIDDWTTDWAVLLDEVGVGDCVIDEAGDFVPTTFLVLEVFS